MQVLRHDPPIIIIFFFIYSEGFSSDQNVKGICGICGIIFAAGCLIVNLVQIETDCW